MPRGVIQKCFWNAGCREAAQELGLGTGIQEGVVPETPGAVEVAVEIPALSLLQPQEAGEGVAAAVSSHRC